MAYTSSASVPALASWGPLVSASTTVGGRIWTYISSDSAGTVSAANYFTNAGQLGLKINDVIFVTDTTNKIVTSHTILTVGSTTDTLSSGVTIGSSS